MDPQLLQTLQEAASSNVWLAILPEMLIAFLALALLVLEMFLPKDKQRFIPQVAIWGTVGVLVWFLLFFFREGGGYLGEQTFAGMLLHDGLGQTMRAFFLLSGALVCYLGRLALAGQPLPKTEFYHITLVVTAAMMLLVQSHHFVMLFVALETVTVGFYILVSYFRHTSVSLEAGLKYLIPGSLSSSLLLFGIVLLYGVAGNPELSGHTAQAMNFSALREFLEWHGDNRLVLAGMVLVLSGVAFKVAAVPFQIWVPDVYQGAPTPVTAFLAIASKAAGFGILITLVRKVFLPLEEIVQPMIVVLAVLTILLGNLAALAQQNTKRLMGLSGIAHAGYLLMGVAAAITVDWAVGAVLFYLFTYLLASFAVFGVMIHVGGPNHADQQLEQFTELGRKSPFLAAVLVIGLGSLAGIPPLAGFIGKLLIFIAAFEAELYVLLGVAIVGVVISIYYYFGWMKVAIFRVWRVASEEPVDPAKGGKALFPVSVGSRMTLGLLAAATVLLGFFQGPLSQWLGSL